MQSVRVTFSDGDSLETDINGTQEEIETYYIGKWFNLGQPLNPVEDRMVQAVSVEFI